MTRVTQGMMNSQLLRNLNHNLQRLNDYQNQLSTGRKINRPSDDPVGITYSLRYRTELAAVDQYQRNVDDAYSSLEFTDQMLNQAGDVLQKLRELAVRGANETNPQTALDAIASEVEQLYGQLVDIGNSKFKGKYIFNGQLTEQRPYPAASLTDTSATTLAMDATPDQGEILYEVGPGVKMPVNLSGADIFGEATDSDNAFRIIEDLHQALQNGDYEKISDLIGRIDTRTDKLLEARAEIGARSNRVELMESRLKDLSVNLQTLQTKTEDADIAEVITNLKIGENIYQASLAVGAKLIRPSLIDFLR